MKTQSLPFTLGRFAACLLLLALLTQAGCRRKRSEPPSGPGPVAEPSAQTGAELSAPTPKAADANAARAVEELNYALQDYRERTGKMPTSLAELVTASKLSLPQLPPGGYLELDQRLKTVKYVGPGGK